MIRFWTDAWNGDPFIDSTSMEELTLKGINPHVFISNLASQGHWNIPPDWFVWFPFLSSRLANVLAPSSDLEDEMGWKHSVSGHLALKDAYLFFAKPNLDCPWSKVIWHLNIPPSRSITVWRMFHHKLPTDDFIMKKGIPLASRCPICLADSDTFQHLLFDCNFTKSLWSWLRMKLHSNHVPSTVPDWLDSNLCLNSPQVALIHGAAVVNSLFSLWQIRNSAKYDNRKPSLKSATEWILQQVQKSGNSSSKGSFISMQDFSFIKDFKVNIIPPKSPTIKEVLWSPPSLGWLKCNCDGSFIPDISKAGCGGIFRNHSGDFTLAFAEPIRFTSSLHAEFGAVIRAMEIAILNGWNKLWVVLHPNF
ncbi:uncharacterized protein LOC131605892 [Vicia villosa]|uniref:uncharacterized protein LOC131605892 n=1 Tax=Vicia villosa TaxID=3911 RepID=UPI00273B44F7|nr:uncharacterized protein LOC131605892 [Vicia villosa]